MDLTSTKPASKETIGNLMQVFANMIRDLYAGMAGEVTSLKALEESHESQLLVVAQRLHLAVSYSLIDLGVSVRASIGTDKTLEK